MEINSILVTPRRAIGGRIFAQCEVTLSDDSKRNIKLNIPTDKIQDTVFIKEQVIKIINTPVVIVSPVSVLPKPFEIK